MEIGSVRRSDLVRIAVTFETELPDVRSRQQLRIRGTVRRMTRRAALDLQRRVFENERTLLVRVTLQTTGIGAGRETRLFEFEAAVCIMTIAALYLAFQHLVVKRPAKLRLRFAVTTDAELRLAATQHVCGQPVLVSPRGL